MKTEYNLLPSAIPCRLGSLKEHGHRAVVVEVNGERKWIEALMALASNGSGLAVTPVPPNWPTIRDSIAQ